MKNKKRKAINLYYFYAMNNLESRGESSFSEEFQKEERKSRFERMLTTNRFIYKIWIQIQLRIINGKSKETKKRQDPASFKKQKKSINF